MKVLCRWALAGALLASTCLPATAAEDRTLTRWAADLDATAAFLKAGRYGRAVPRLKRLTDEMVQLLGPGTGAARVLAATISQRALAEAGLGNLDDALWYWHVAIGIEPEFLRSDLSEFGEPGRFLQANSLPPPGPADPAGPPDPFLEAPKARKRPRPVYPAGAKYFEVQGQLIVEVVLGVDGRPRYPKVLQPLPAPTLTFVALDAVRQWRFEPARSRGQAVEVHYRLTVNWEMPR